MKGSITTTKEKCKMKIIELKTPDTKYYNQSFSSQLWKHTIVTILNYHTHFNKSWEKMPLKLIEN